MLVVQSSVNPSGSTVSAASDSSTLPAVTKQTGFVAKYRAVFDVPAPSSIVAQTEYPPPNGDQNPAICLTSPSHVAEDVLPALKKIMHDA